TSQPPLPTLSPAGRGSETPCPSDSTRPLKLVKENPLQLESTVETRTYPVLSGAFLIGLAVALVAVSWAVGTETYLYIHRCIAYRFPLATLDRVYLIALGILALHYAAYVAHYVLVGSRQQAGPPPPLTFSPVKFVIT